MICRGCRQCDPISPYLVLLCAEVLGILIRNNKNIRGIKTDGVEYKLSQYADDTSIKFHGSPQSMNGVLIELDYFTCIPGIKINFSKTTMVWIGSKKIQNKFFTTCIGSSIGTIPLFIYLVSNFLLI